MPNEKYAGEFYSEDAFQALLQLLRDEHQCLNKARELCLKQHSEQWVVLNHLIYSMYDSLESVTWLASSHKLRDCYVVGRVVVETAVNLAFVCAQGECAAQRALSHARQKWYRNLDRQSEINGLKLNLHCTAKDSIIVDEKLQKDIDAFTHRNGRENTSWTPETVNQRLEIISQKYGKKKSGDLQWAFFSIYRHASEIAHGTLFGAMYTLGRMEDIQSQDDFVNHQRGQANLLCLMLGGVVSATIGILALELEELSDLADESDQIIKGVKIPGITSSASNTPQL